MIAVIAWRKPGGSLEIISSLRLRVAELQAA
jgi:hypothetical protein